MRKGMYRVLSGKIGADMEIRILIRQTAKAFGEETPQIEGLSTKDLLREYARFTSKSSLNAIQSGADLKALHRKLFQMAYRLGSRVRRLIRPKDEQEAFQILALLYRNIRITIRETGPKEYGVLSCYFSDFYTPEVCSVISAIDQGIFAGIFQGGALTFHQRITEGNEVCRATLEIGKEKET